MDNITELHSDDFELVNETSPLHSDVAFIRTTREFQGEGFYTVRLPWPSRKYFCFVSAYVTDRKGKPTPSLNTIIVRSFQPDFDKKEVSVNYTVSGSGRSHVSLCVLTPAS